MSQLFLIFGIAIIFFFIGYFLRGKRRKESGSSIKSTPEEVGRFYNEQTDNFLKVYGEVIQAFRTTDVSELLDYQIESMGLEADMLVCDAGCGVCGPARYFAKEAKVRVEAVTISSVQMEKSKDLIQKDNLESRVNVQQGDYHQLDSYFPKDHFDRVYFLESFGHAEDQKKVLDSAWEVLKPGGMLYIKDLFKKIAPIDSLNEEMAVEIDNINRAYRYNVADLNETLNFLRKKGFIISAVKTIDVKLESFENLTISNDFQELTGINKIENLQDYVFPVDFFEIKCLKPWHDLSIGNSRYFMQNLFYLQVKGRSEDEL